MSRERRAAPRVNPVDVDLARIYLEEDATLRTRESLGPFLERNGLGINHHTFSNCPDRVVYINLVLDALGLE